MNNLLVHGLANQLMPVYLKNKDIVVFGLALCCRIYRFASAWCGCAVRLIHRSTSEGRKLATKEPSPEGVEALIMGMGSSVSTSRKSKNLCVLPTHR